MAAQPAQPALQLTSRQSESKAHESGSNGNPKSEDGRQPKTNPPPDGNIQSATAFESDPKGA
eukprot:2798423-Amphidinium_carterae.1